MMRRGGRNRWTSYENCARLADIRRTTCIATELYPTAELDESRRNRWRY